MYHLLKDILSVPDHPLCPDKEEEVDQGVHMAELKAPERPCQDWPSLAGTWVSLVQPQSRLAGSRGVSRQQGSGGY